MKHESSATDFYEVIKKYNVEAVKRYESLRLRMTLDELESMTVNQKKTPTSQQ